MQLMINLASRRHLNQRSFNLWFSLLVVALIGLLIWQGRTIFHVIQAEQNYQDNLRALQGQLVGEMPEKQSTEELTRRQVAYDRAAILLQQDAFRWTVLFDRMEQLLPDGISLRSFNPDYEENSLVITGVARDLSRLQELLDNLHGADFQYAYLVNQGEIPVDDRRGGKKTALSFSIDLAGVF